MVYGSILLVKIVPFVRIACHSTVLGRCVAAAHVVLSLKTHFVYCFSSSPLPYLCSFASSSSSFSPLCSLRAFSCALVHSVFTLSVLRARVSVLKGAVVSISFGDFKIASFMMRQGRRIDTFFRSIKSNKHQIKLILLYYHWHCCVADVVLKTARHHLPRPIPLQ